MEKKEFTFQGTVIYGFLMLFINLAVLILSFAAIIYGIIMIDEGTESYRLTDVFPDENGKLIINLDEDTKNGIKAYEPIFIKLEEEAENTAMQINQYIQVNEDYDADREPIVELQNGWKLVGTKNYGYVPADAKYLKDNYYYTAGNNKTIIRAYRAYFIAPADVNDMFSSRKPYIWLA